MDQKIGWCTVVGDYIQYYEDDFFIQVLDVYKLYLNYKFTSNQREAFFNWQLLLISMFMYACCLTAWYKSKLKSKVVFIVLI